MARSLVVQKYGGTSVGSIDRISHVAKHISETVASGKSVVAVISAMGEQTDDLLAMARSISKKPPRREIDMLLTAGERISMALVSIALNELGTKAVSLTGSQSGIITDTTHGNARISKILDQRIQTNLDLGSVVIVAGFQGVSQESKEITTLGRGGSDLSAIALAGHLKASECQLFKDVDGVCSADPRLVRSANILRHVSWDTMTEMAWSGASVLHPRGAHLAAKYQIPIEIRSSFNLDRPGTLVTGHTIMEKFSVFAITHRNNMVLVTGQLNGSDGSALNALRTWLWEQGETPQMQTQTTHGGKTTFSWSMPQSLLQEAADILRQNGSLAEELGITPCGLITLVGGGFWQSPEFIPDIQRIVPQTHFLDIKNNAVMIAVNQHDVDATIVNLHKAFVERNA